MKQRNVQRVTKRRTSRLPLTYNIYVNGMHVGSAYSGGAGLAAEPGWYVVTKPPLGLTLYNSWLNGDAHQSVTHAAETAIAYVKKCLREKKEQEQVPA